MTLINENNFLSNWAQKLFQRMYMKAYITISKIGKVVSTQRYTWQNFGSRLLRLVALVIDRV